MKILSLPAILLLAACAVSPQAARAEDAPSAESIIRALRPAPPAVSSDTRGIRPASPGGPSPSALPATNPVARPPPSVNLTVEFATNSAELTPAAVGTLTELGRALSSPALGSYKFRIEGHTDTVGLPQANKVLSERRARAVVGFLTGRFGIDGARLDPVGMGEEGLLVPTRPNTPEPRNRRVQVINVGG